MGVPYFGSYARGGWGVGSDLDLLLIVERSARPFWDCASELDLGGLPVPREAIVCTADEWSALAEGNGRFFRTIQAEATWLYRAPTWNANEQ